MPQIPTPPHRRNGRKLWLKIHLVIALMLGLELTLVGLTTSGRGLRKSIDDIFATVRAAVPEATGPDASISVQIPTHPNSTYQAWIKIPGVMADDARWQQVSLDPYTGIVLAVREADVYLISILYSLHYTLLLGEWGETAVGISGFLLLLSVFSGVYLWWPRPGKTAQAFIINYHTSRTRLNFDLHRVNGIDVALLVVVVSVSGISMIFPNYVKLVVRVFSSISDVPQQLTSMPQHGLAPMQPSRAITTAASAYPHAELTSIELTSMGPEGVYAVHLRQPGEVRKSGGATVVWVDQYRGDILHRRDPRTMSAGDTFLLWQFPLHNGEAFGLPGRLAILLSGLSLPLLYVTGLCIWWRKRRAHTRAQHLEH